MTISDPLADLTLGRYGATIEQVLAALDPPPQFQPPSYKRLMLQFYDPYKSPWYEAWQIDRLGLRYQIAVRTAQKRAAEEAASRAAEDTIAEDTAEDTAEDENPLNRALEPLALTEDEARELDDVIERAPALPTLPVEGVPHRERDTVASAPPTTERAAEDVVQSPTVADIIVTVERYLLVHPEVVEVCALQGLNEGQTRFAVSRTLYGDDTLMQLGMFPQYLRAVALERQRAEIAAAEARAAEEAEEEENESDLCTPNASSDPTGEDENDRALDPSRSSDVASDAPPNVIPFPSPTTKKSRPSTSGRPTPTPPIAARSSHTSSLRTLPRRSRSRPRTSAAPTKKGRSRSASR